MSDETDRQEVENEIPVEQHPRILAMERIAEQREKEFDEVLTAEEQPASEPERAAETARNPEGEELAAQIEKQLLDPATDGDRVNIKVKIDGEEREVPLAKVIETYQKSEAADKRLEEATALLRSAQQLKEQESAAVKTETTSERPNEPVEDVKARVKEALVKLYEGDDDKAAEVLAALIASREQTPSQVPNPVDLAQQVKDQLAAEQAFEKVRQDYPEVISNPDLDLLASIKAKNLLDRGVPRHEAILAAAREVGELIGKGRPEVSNVMAARDEKLERKAHLDRVPSATAAASSQIAQEDDSPSSVIAEMARRRLGQSLAIR